jgi:hypothetical protein
VVAGAFPEDSIDANASQPLDSFTQHRVAHEHDVSAATRTRTALAATPRARAGSRTDLRRKSKAGG